MTWHCYGGLDLSSTTDISALVLVFPPQNGRPDFQVRPYFWVPAEGVSERVNRDRVPYDVWISDGLITATEGAIIDYDVIRRDVNRLGDVYELREIGFDPWNATQIATQLMGDGFAMVKMRQGFQTLSEPMKLLEAMVLERKIAHGGHPVLRWMASNVAAREDSNGNIAPAKDKSTGRIDGILALIMALGRATVQPEKKVSVYEGRGLAVL